MNELKPCPFCGTIPEIQICDRDGMIYPGSDYTYYMGKEG